MKRLKKLLAVLVTMITVIAMMVPVSAAGYTVTIIPKDSGDHTFTAYQIFSGTISSDGVTLTDIQWGDGVNGASLLNAILTANGDSSGELYNTISDTTTFTSAADVADWLATLDKTQAEAFATLAEGYLGTAAGTTSSADGDGYYRITGLDAGYYLITDELDSSSPEGAESDTILSVVTDVTITAKSELPSVTKTADTETAGIGDTIEYIITGTLTGADLSGYQTYSYTLTDIMDGCLDLVYTYPSGDTTDVNGGVTITVNDGNNTDVTQYFTITYTEDASGNHVLTLTCDDVKSMGSVTVTTDTVFTITYSVTVNSSLDGGSMTNTVQLKTEEATTPKIIETVYAIDLDLTKVDGTDNSITLEGATFVLKNSAGEYLQVDANNKVYKWVPDKVDASELTTDSYGKLKVYGLSEGTYYLEETVAPEGYNLLANDLTIVITAATDPSTGELTSLKYTVDGGASQNGTISSTGNTVSIKVENNQGATLPSTGGIGTTLLYVCGSILGLAIVILLITKIRMKVED